MGPLQTADLTGVDIITNASSNIYADTQDEVRAAGIAAPHGRRRRLGQKTGKGFYTYQ